MVDTIDPTEPAGDLAGLPEDIRREVIAFRTARPFLSRCLSLNHDINNPLAGIIGYAEVLLEDGGQLTEDQRQGLEHILRCAQKIAALAGRLSEDKLRLIDSAVVDLLQTTPHDA